MKSAPFDYERPSSLDDAVARLAVLGRDAKILAGGQSLIPMLNLRLVDVSCLIDISRLTELNFIDERVETIRIGAATTHNAILNSSIIARYLPLLTEAYGHVAHHSIRNRGTLGGSLCHADPAAEMPLVVALLDATITVQSSRGRRDVKAIEFFRSAFETVIAVDEILTEISFPKPVLEHGWSFQEVNQRHGDFALVAAGVLLELDGSACRKVRIGYRNVGETVFRVPQVENLLEGSILSTEKISDASELAVRYVKPGEDLHADAEYRLDLVRTLTARVLESALARANAPTRTAFLNRETENG